MKEATAIIGAQWILDDEPANEISPGIQEVTFLVSKLLSVVIKKSDISLEEMKAAHLVVGSHFGRLEYIEKGGLQADRLGLTDYFNPNFFVHSISGAISGQAAIDNHISGPAININTEDLSGLDAIGYSHLTAQLEEGVYLAVGADSSVAIEAASFKNASLKYQGGAGVLILCHKKLLEVSGRRPLAYILKYGSGRIKESVTNDKPVVGELLKELFQTGASKIYLIHFGSLLSELRSPEVQYPSIVGHLHLDEVFGYTAGAAGALALSMLVSGHPIFSEVVVESENFQVVIAGGSYHGKYSYMVIGF